MRFTPVITILFSLMLIGCDGTVVTSGNDISGLVDSDKSAQVLTFIDLTSLDGGNSLVGTLGFTGGETGEFVAALNSENAGSNYNGQYKRSSDESFGPYGYWVLGSRNTQPIYRLRVDSPDNGNSFIGATAYAGEGPIEFSAVRSRPSVVYEVNHSIGGQGSVDGAAWVLGNRGDLQQYLVAVDIASEDGGVTLSGTISYSGEQPVEMRASSIIGNAYQVENKFGGENSPWVDVGVWLIGGRNQRCVELQAFSSDSGESLVGVARYDSESAIAFSAQRSGGVAYLVEIQYVGNSAPWRSNGLWVFGSN